MRDTAVTIEFYVGLHVVVCGEHQFTPKNRNSGADIMYLGTSVCAGMKKVLVVVHTFITSRLGAVEKTK